MGSRARSHISENRLPSFLPPPNPFFSPPCNSHPDWNSIRSRFRFTSRHRRLIPGCNSDEFNSPDMSRTRKNKPYGHRGVVSVVMKKKKKRREKKIHVGITFACSSSGDVWSRENCNSLAISDQHETIKKKKKMTTARFFLLLQFPSCMTVNNGETKRSFFLLRNDRRHIPHATRGYFAIISDRGYIRCRSEGGLFRNSCENVTSFSDNFDSLIV